MSQFDKYIKIGQEMISENKEVISEGITIVRVNKYAENNAELKKLLPTNLKVIYVGEDDTGSLYMSKDSSKLGKDNFKKKLMKNRISNVMDLYAVLFDNIESVKSLNADDLESHYIDSKAKVRKISLADAIGIGEADGVEEIYFVL